jgi:S-adenosylmethionine/arginine decarboxylase-like enzyme
MKVFIGPYAKYCDMQGNKGLTVMAVIETSHIVMHVWDEVNPALIQLDIYSCGDFDEHDVCKKISKDFDLSKIEYKYLNRETGLTDISQGIMNYK